MHAIQSGLIPIGEPAPDFAAEASDGTNVRLLGLRPRPVVLVFYPGDNTPGCTAQLCAIRDDWASLQREQILVFGVNPAGTGTHARFASRQRLPFPLLADHKGRIAAAYGCRMLFGLTRRTVYGIDGAGRIVFARRGAPAPAEILQAIIPARGAGEQPINEPG
jgi:peroxiredoxin Q/BCP